MNFLQSEEQRIRKTVEEERSLSLRLSRKVLKCKLLALATGLLIVTAVTVGLIAMLLGGDSGAWAFPIMFLSGFGAVVSLVLSRKAAEGLGFMKATLKDYRDFLSKMKEKGKV